MVEVGAYSAVRIRPPRKYSDASTSGIGCHLYRNENGCYQPGIPVVPIDSPARGLVSIAGGNWTMYRKVAEDAVDHIIEVGDLRPKAGPCATAALPLLGGHRYTPQLPFQLRCPSSTRVGSWMGRCRMIFFILILLLTLFRMDFTKSSLPCRLPFLR